MNKSDFAQKLFSERKRLGHNQDHVAELLNMTQSAYSRMEKGKTNPGVERSLEIIKILAPHGYNDIPPVQLEEIEGQTAIVIRWPWNKYGLYAILVILAILILDFVIHGARDFAWGLYEGYTGKTDTEEPGGFVILPLLLIAGMYWLFHTVKWRLLKRS